MFFERFKTLCATKGKNPQSKEILSSLDISSGTVSGWAKGKEPKAETLRKIAMYFNCTADYLLEITDKTDYKQNINDDEKTIIECYRQSDRKGKAKITQIAMNEMERTEREHSESNSASAG